MCLWNRGRDDLVVLLQRRLEAAPAERGGTLLDVLALDCAVDDGVRDMERALAGPGLDRGVEPTR